jgi:hypothetical protein
MTEVLISREDRCRRGEAHVMKGTEKEVLQWEARKVKNCKKNCRIQEEAWKSSSLKISHRTMVLPTPGIVFL